MGLDAINPPGVNPPGYSQSMAIEGSRLLLLSGHVPVDETGTVVGTDVSTQLAKVLENMGETLTAAGVGFEALARVTIYVVDFTPDMLPILRQTRDRYIATSRPPASTLIGVTSLFHPDVLVEVDGVAVLDF